MYILGPFLSLGGTGGRGREAGRDTFPGLEFRVELSAEREDRSMMSQSQHTYLAEVLIPSA